MIELLVYTFVVALVLTLIFGRIGIPLLRRLHAQQSIREEGPQSHQSKAGTPTMGGLFFLLALTITTILFTPSYPITGLLLFLTLGHGALGFFDDFIKAKKKRNLGLSAKQKLVGQAIMAIIFCYFSHYLPMMDMKLWIPVVGTSVSLGWFYYVFVFFVIVGTTNAVNLTDGLDGLAAGTSAIAAAAFAVVAIIVGMWPVALYASALCAVCLGFLVFNANPAKVFMGDTGSLALGGAFAAIAVATSSELLLVIIGGVFVMEALSVILQVLSFKTRGVRIFKMSPIHHHFELSGWSERKVVTRFWLLGCILAIIGLILAVPMN